MAKEKQSQDQRIDQFFSGPGARADHWRFLVDAAKAWSDGWYHLAVTGYSSDAPVDVKVRFYHARRLGP